jgi:hypothetical protein
MVNNTKKAVVAVLLMVPAGSVIATGPYQCNAAQGNNITITGNSTCNPNGSVSLTGSASRKKGDLVTFPAGFIQKNARTQQLQENGNIQFPSAGSWTSLKLGNSQVVIGTFDLHARNANVPSALQKIITQGKKDNPDADMMSWFAFAKNGSNTFTELAETYSKKGTRNSLTYRKTGANSVVIMENGQETLKVDTSK